ncbi:EAL domain-containing protein [Marinobacterium sp. xm-d-564]|uniref:bifunctional diguanylate cyclase/phosphodiesterase n=1 Tax=Marinobacterium sp. xm-d-564 TaxID=2497742 RepID=UPI001568E259|nr:EAL domain-containing protein [Marinobacterium sp. xm-d-564]NRP60120.1 RNase E specificity factor CsrD [Marinobacterium sp. xm-d-564]
MSLVKQLWIGIILLMAIAFGGSFVVSSLSAKNYLEKQLTIKNSDNVNALALSLSRSQADPVMLELTLAAQFDTGFYKEIKLTGADGTTLVERTDNSPVTEAPNWFIELFPINAIPGAAAIQDGWTQVGMLTLESHNRFAYSELWSSTKKLFSYFVVAAALAGLLGSLLLRVITQPLSSVVSQAKAISERRFITTPEPKTLEFKSVVSSMNSLSDRIQAMLKQETDRLEQWRKNAQLDRITKVLNRDPFMGKLSAALGHDDESSNGAVILFRIPNLQEINREIGRIDADKLLAGIGDTLSDYVVKNSDWAAGRLNGSDFALLAAGNENPSHLATELQQKVKEVARRLDVHSLDTIPMSAAQYSPKSTLAELMTILDTKIQEAQIKSLIDPVIIESFGQSDVQGNNSTEHWSALISDALTTKAFSLVQFPVVSVQGNLVHNETAARLNVQGSLIQAGEFIPWLQRLKRTADFDKALIEQAIKTLENSDSAIAVNLTPASLDDSLFKQWLINTLNEVPKAASRLSIEIPEQGAHQRIAAFKELIQNLKPMGVRVGIKHAGQDIERISALHDLGLDYVKIDASLIRNIDKDMQNQTLLRALCLVLHSIGFTAIAAMVQTPEEWNILNELGLDAGAGPEAKNHLSD